MTMLKESKTQIYYLLKSAFKNYNVVMLMNLYDKAIDFYVKRYEETRKFTTGPGDDYTLLGYEYIKNHYRLTAVALSRQKELDPALKAIEQIAFVLEDVNAGWCTIYVCSNDFRKNKKIKAKVLSRKSKSLIKDGESWKSKG